MASLSKWTPCSAADQWKTDESVPDDVINKEASTNMNNSQEKVVRPYDKLIEISTAKNVSCDDINLS